MFTTHSYRVTIDRPNIYTDTYITRDHDMAEGKFLDLVDDAKSYGWSCHITFDYIETIIDDSPLSPRDRVENRIGEYRHD